MLLPRAGATDAREGPCIASNEKEHRALLVSSPAQKAPSHTAYGRMIPASLWEPPSSTIYA